MCKIIHKQLVFLTGWFSLWFTQGAPLCACQALNGEPFTKCNICRNILRLAFKKITNLLAGIVLGRENDSSKGCAEMIISTGLIRITLMGLVKIMKEWDGDLVLYALFGFWDGGRWTWTLSGKNYSRSPACYQWKVSNFHWKVQLW